jgi:hypothetical protein
MSDSFVLLAGKITGVNTGDACSIHYISVLQRGLEIGKAVLQREQSGMGKTWRLGDQCRRDKEHANIKPRKTKGESNDF